jgi:hypothetical protein
MAHVGEGVLFVLLSKVKTVGLAPHGNYPKAYDYNNSSLEFISLSSYV